MVSYFVRRTWQVVWSVYIAISATFVMIKFMPGDAMDYLEGILRANEVEVTESLRKAMVATINLNPEQPLHEQYFTYMTRVLQGKLGISIWFSEPVSAILADAIPWTALLALLSLSLMVSIGLVLGALTAYIEGSRTDAAVSIYSTLATSTPYYVVAIILLWYLGFALEWFPTGGRVSDFVDPSEPIAYMGSVLHHVALPVMSLVITGIGGWALNMRGNCISIMGEDYIRVARLRGLSERRVALRYVGRNAILPLYTRLLIGLGTIFGGAVVLETIFRYRGVGFYLFRAISARDLPLMMGTFMLITIGMMLAVYFADLTYGIIDPRAKVGGQYE